MQNMQATETAQGGKTTVVIRTSTALAQEFYRLARGRHGRSGNAQGEFILREWVASEQAAEAADAAEGKAA